MLPIAKSCHSNQGGATYWSCGVIANSILLALLEYDIAIYHSHAAVECWQLNLSAAVEYWSCGIRNINSRVHS